MRTALVTHPACLDHKTPATIHEKPARLERVLQALDPLGLPTYQARLATDKDLCRLHTPEHVKAMFDAIPNDGFLCLDEGVDDETFLSPTSAEAMRRAAGGVMDAVDLVLAGKATNAFVAVRPPGHHATQDLAMGFCFFGNVALGAAYALEQVERVAIVDFDVHHGNGTQALLWDEPRALVITSQQFPHWPGSGDASDISPHGNVVNIPLAPHTGGAVMRAAYLDRVFPRLRIFKPDLILISAGFDAHQADPLGDLQWGEDDFV